MEWFARGTPKGRSTRSVDRGGLLTVAVRHNRPEILWLLLDFGFDPDERVSWAKRLGEPAISRDIRCGMRGLGQARDG